MSYIGNTPGVSSQRVVLEEVVSGSPKSAFVPQSGYIIGYVDVLVNGVEIDSTDFSAPDGVTVTLVTAAAVGDTVKIKTWLPRGLSDGYLKTEADARFLNLAGGQLTGNVAIGAGLSSWGSAHKALQFGTVGAVSSDTGWARLWQNAYSDGSNYRYTANGAAGVLLFGNQGLYAYSAPSGTAGGIATMTNTFSLDGSGRVKLATSTGQQAPSATGDITATGILALTAGGGDYLTIGQYSGSRFWFQGSYGANASLAYYDICFQPLGGNIVIGTSLPDNLWRGTGVANGSHFGAAYSAIQCSSNTNLYMSKAAGYSAAAFTEFYVGGGLKGSINTNGTSVSFNTSSDYRLKDITGPMVGALARNKLLQPKVGTWKSDGSPFEGFLAHELKDVFDHAAHGEKDAVDADGNPVYQGVGTGPLDAHFSACINELQDTIDQLRAEVAALKG